MASQIKSGISTYVGNFQQFIEVCEGFGTPYNPSLPKLHQAFPLPVRKFLLLYLILHKSFNKSMC
jgi:hypothetical protein